MYDTNGRFSGNNEEVILGRRIPRQRVDSDQLIERLGVERRGSAVDLVGANWRRPVFRVELTPADAAALGRKLLAAALDAKGQRPATDPGS